MVQRETLAVQLASDSGAGRLLLLRLRFSVVHHENVIGKRPEGSERQRLPVHTVATLTMGLLWAVVYGLVLTVVAAVLWMRVVLAMEPEPAMVGMFALFHVIYGAVLGIAVVSLPL